MNTPLFLYNFTLPKEQNTYMLGSVVNGKVETLHPFRDLNNVVNIVIIVLIIMIFVSIIFKAV
jgi:hypothetical protein